MEFFFPPQRLYVSCLEYGGITFVLRKQHLKIFLDSGKDVDVDVDVGMSPIVRLWDLGL